MRTSYIVSSHCAFTQHRFKQEDLLHALLAFWNPEEKVRVKVEKLYKSVGVGHRHLALSPEAYLGLDTFDKRNNAFLKVAEELAEQAAKGVLEQAGVEPKQINSVWYTSVTGLSVPSLDARLVNRLHMSHFVKRIPLFGLGCGGGAGAIARAHDYLVGHPKETALVVAVELCSLTLQRDDLSVANLVGSALFGDGAGAVVLMGEEARKNGSIQKPLPCIRDTVSVFFPETEYVMGWDIGSHGFKLVLSPDVPTLSSEKLVPHVERFLHEHGLSSQHIQHWIAHPGGPKVINAIESGLCLQEGSLNVSRNCLKEVGNLSSASVIWVLNETLKKTEIRAGNKGVLMAMGPGFSAELVLLEWE